MKKLVLAAFPVLLLLVAQHTFAQSTLIHYWNFNSYTRNDTYPDIQPIDADYSILDTGMAKIWYIAQAGYDPTSYDSITYMGTYTASDTAGESVNLRNGDSVGNAIRVANPSDSMQLLFFIPTTHFQNIVVKFVSYPSSTSSGQKVQLYDYSTDSGATWKTTGLSKTTDTFYSKFWRMDSLNFGTDTTVNNNPGLVFRIRFSLQTTSTSGNNRFDNVTVDGDSILTTTDTSTTSVSNVTALNNTVVVYPNPASNVINICTPTNTAKGITINDVCGKQVYTGKYSDKNILLNIAPFTPGMYYIHVQMANGQTYRTTFVKN